MYSEEESTRGVARLSSLCTTCRMPHDVPDHVRRLLSTRIDTFEKLEIVAALAVAPQTTLTVDQIAITVRIPRDVIRQAIVELRSATLVQLTERGAIKLLSLSQGDQTAVTDLLEAYALDPLSVAKFLGEIAMERIRNMASRAFADAFVPRKKPTEGES